MMRTASQFWRAEQGTQVEHRRHHASPPPPPPPPPQQLMMLVLVLLLATTTSVTQALPTSHIFSSSHKGIGSAAAATPPNINLHLAHQPNIPEEELELENLKDSANGAGAERNAPFSGAGAVSKKSGDKGKDLASPTTNRPAAYVKKPENEETPALSDNANSLKYGGAAADLEEALANLAHIPPSKAPSLSVTSGKSLDGQNSKRTRPGTGFSSGGGGGVSTGMGLLSRAGVNLEVDYTPQDIAEYIFWMGDERGVELAINDFVQEGLITPQDAVKFLEEVKVELSLLRNRYASTVSAGSPGRIDNNDNSVRGFWEVPARGLSKKQSAANTFLGNGYPFASSSLSSMEQLNAYPSNGNSWSQSRPSSSSARGGGVYEKDSGTSVEDMLDYEEIVEKLRQADSKVRELALEGIIYELARELFSTGLEQSPGTSVPTFTTFIENLAANGNISKDLERSVLETLVQALVDAANERGLLIAKEGHSTRVLNSSGKLGTGLSGAQAANGAQAKPILIKKKSIT